MPSRLFVLCLLLAAAPVQAEEAPLPLAAVLQQVLARGPESAVAAAGIDVARAEVRGAAMFPNPSVSLALAKAEPIVSAAVQVRLPILGQRSSQIHAAERGVDRAQAEATATRWRLRHEARLAYYAAVRSAADLSVARELEVLAGRVAAMARQRFEAGSGARLDQDQALLLHVRAQQEISDRQAAERAARLALGRLLGDPQSQAPLADALEVFGDTPPLDDLLAAARARHPELLTLRAARTAALARAHAARMERVPVPLIELGVDVLEPATCGNAAGSRCAGPRGGLSLDLPVFNQNGGPLALALAEARVAEAQLNAAQVRAEAEVRAAFTAWSAASQRARFYEETYVPTANSVEQMAREGFAAGRTGLLPLLAAERSVLEARLGRAEALFAAQAARADLEEASGVALSAP